MTYNPNHDRTDWRARTDRELIEAARESGHELAIVLGERLEDSEGMDDALADTRAELIELQGRCDALRAEVEALRAAVAMLMEAPDATDDGRD